MLRINWWFGELARILLDVEALQLDKLLKSKFAQCDSFPGVLPSRPGKVLALLIYLQLVTRQIDLLDWESRIY